MSCTWFFFPSIGALPLSWGSASSCAAGARARRLNSKRLPLLKFVQTKRLLETRSHLHASVDGCLCFGRGVVLFEEDGPLSSLPVHTMLVHACAKRPRDAMLQLKRVGCRGWDEMDLVLLCSPVIRLSLPCLPIMRFLVPCCCCYRTTRKSLPLVRARDEVVLQ
jgi:hypothetical protein